MWQQQILVDFGGTQVVTQVAGRLPVIDNPSRCLTGSYMALVPAQSTVLDPDGTITVRGSLK